jgi:hypothetical protein
MLMSVNGNLVKKWVVVPTLVGPHLSEHLWGGPCLKGDPLEKLEIHFSLWAAPKRGSRFLSLRMEITFRTSSVL